MVWNLIYTSNGGGQRTVLCEKEIAKGMLRKMYFPMVLSVRSKQLEGQVNLSEGKKEKKKEKKPKTK